MSENELESHPAVLIKRRHAWGQGTVVPSGPDKWLVQLLYQRGNLRRVDVKGPGRSSLAQVVEREHVEALRSMVWPVARRVEARGRNAAGDDQCLLICRNWNAGDFE
jgi:hypothetical protein